MTNLISAAYERAAHERATQDAMGVIEAADRLTAGGTPDLAAAAYRDWLDQHPDDRLRYAVAFNLAVLLSNLDDQPAAEALLAEVIAARPDFLPAYINSGMVLERLGRTADAVARWQDVVSRLSPVEPGALAHKTMALRQLGRVMSAAHLDSQAEGVMRHSLEIAPQQRDVLLHWLSLRQRQCDWPVLRPLPGFTRARLVAGMSPLTLAAHTDDPLLQLGVAAEYCRREIGRPRRSLASSHAALLANPFPIRLRIGYLSSDLRQHAIGHLMAEIFELHDRETVEIFAYYCGHKVDDTLHRRIRAGVDRWIDLSTLSDDEAADRIVADGIHILIDVNGYTHGARTRMLAMRPAPVIVNWLGFPNTTGSPFHDYIIGDAVITPPEHDIHYSETVKRLPCYQPNDRRRVVADDPGTRAEAGLPSDGTVFCCFNVTHKISRFTWRRWMEILIAVPGSVLWLLDGVSSTNERLRGHAATSGIDPARVVFAEKRTNPHHLARYVLADLFLDSSPYGAHTTGSDALWMGVPLLTLLGRSFASRVSSSLVTAAGLPELVCRTSDEYVARAVELGSDRRKMVEMRERLRGNRNSCVLFDTPALVAHLETLFWEIWQEKVDGRTKRPNLSNLHVYKEIGADLDSDDIEMGQVADYRDRYVTRLIEHDRHEQLPADPRLWAGRG